MARMQVTESDLGVLRHMLDPARPSDPDELIAQSLLEDLQALVPCDNVTLQVMTSLDDRRIKRWVQDAGDYPAEVEDDDETAAEFWDWLPCSYPQRTGSTDVTRLTDFANDYGAEPGVAGRVLVPLPVPDHEDHRIMLWRFEGSDFTERDVLLMMLLQPHITDMHAAQLRRRSGVPELTKRQTDVLRLVAAGCTNRQIARALDISEGTVRKHLENTYATLGASSRTEALAAVGAVHQPA